MILTSEQRWTCPNCLHAEVTVGQPNRFHNCSGLRGIIAPLVLAGTRCKVVAEERQDYVGREDVRLDGEGRPVMAVRTVRDDGEDLAVFAPTVNVRLVI
jgi:hypothetical protein